MSAGTSYAEFIRKKSQVGDAHGFEPLWMPSYLKDFQVHLDDWAIRKGRAAIFAGCGMGKTPMYFVWAENVVRHTNRPVLVATTLGDSDQAVREATTKFQVDAVRSRDGKFPSGARVVVTNYERLQHFDPADFVGFVGNESSILKNFKGRRKKIVTEFMRTLPYRLLTTATAAPNDYIELGTSSEALGELGHKDMLTRFFVKSLAARGTIGWGRELWRMKGHAENDFWRWVCSWARACRKPSDVGPFDDAPFVLPELTTAEHVIEADSPPGDCLFDLPAITIQEQRDELRRTLKARCEKVAELLAHDEPAIAWCYLNEESRLLARLIPGAVEVSGSDSDDRKEEIYNAFVAGQIRKIVSKPKICGFGQNWQHCNHMTFFVSHSWEQWHQSLRRCWRYGQTRPVRADLISTPGLRSVLANLQRKEEQVQRMFNRLVAMMSDTLKLTRHREFVVPETAPSWLCSIA
jgi:hypothetical protein